MSAPLLKIGTRDSKLALWQATLTQQLLGEQGIISELVPVKSEGDLDLVTPLYAMGVEGVFTKTLDAYLLSGKIDIAVHSMKDVPTQLAAGISQGAVLERANTKDLLLYKTASFCQAFMQEIPSALEGVVATGSVRRRAQILHRFPHLKIEDLRGNVQTRQQKLADHPWDGAIFAAAGLERIEERPPMAREIEWMLPAPAQGAIVVVARTEDLSTLRQVRLLNHADTAFCVKIERDFLSTLMGGCSTPISALAIIKNQEVHLSGNILSPDGKEIFETALTAPLHQAENLGITAAKALLDQGADRLVAAIRNQ